MSVKTIVQNLYKKKKLNTMRDIQIKIKHFHETLKRYEIIYGYEKEVNIFCTSFKIYKRHLFILFELIQLKFLTF